MGMLVITGIGFVVGFVVRHLMEPKKRKARVLPLKNEAPLITHQPLQEIKVKPPRARRTADQNAIAAEKVRENGHDKDPLPS